MIIGITFAAVTTILVTASLFGWFVFKRKLNAVPDGMIYISMNPDYIAGEFWKLTLYSNIWF